MICRSQVTCEINNFFNDLYGDQGSETKEVLVSNAVDHHSSLLRRSMHTMAARMCVSFLSCL